MSLIRRCARATDAPPPVLPDGEIVCVLQLPALYEFLTLSSWDDGAKRLRGTFSCFFEDGAFKLWLNDKDGGRSACVSHWTWAGALLKADEGLSADTLEWRKARPEQGRAGKK